MESVLNLPRTRGRVTATNTQATIKLARDAILHHPVVPWPGETLTCSFLSYHAIMIKVPEFSVNHW